VIQFLSITQASTQRQFELWCWSNSSFVLLALLFMIFSEIMVFKIIDLCCYLYLDRLLNLIFLCYLVPYSCLDPYTSHSDYCTVPERGFSLMDTASIRYGLRPYIYCKEYSHSHIQYSWQPYARVSLAEVEMSDKLCDGQLDTLTASSVIIEWLRKRFQTQHRHTVLCVFLWVS